MCTSFAVYHKKGAVYGMNFDTDEIDLKLKVDCYQGKNFFLLFSFNRKQIQGYRRI